MREDSAEQESTKEMIVRALRYGQITSVGQLAARISDKNAFDEDVFIETIRCMVKEGSLVLEKPSYLIISPLDYLLTPSLSGWFWGTIILTALTIGLVSAPDVVPFNVLRWVLGPIFLLFLPGYSFLRLLFPEELDMKKSERLILSVVVSLPIIIMIGLLLNYTPFGIRLGSLIDLVSAFTVILAATATARGFMLNKS